MKHLKYFETEAEYTAYKNSSDFVTPNVSYTADVDSVCYHVVKTETGDYKIFLLEKKDISGLTYNMVDLGLPSGILWADRNVGASTPEDFGTYFAWGETTGYNVSTSAGYCTAAELCARLQPGFGDEITLTPDNIDEVLSMMGVSGKDMTTVGMGFGKNKCFSSDWSDYFDTTDGGNTFNKYNDNGGFTVLQPEDDAATVKMGSDWRMPTYTELNELENNCTVAFIDLNDNEYSESEVQSGTIEHYNLKGIKFTGPNGNSIFIPAAGTASVSGVGNIKEYGFIPYNSLEYDKYCKGMRFNTDYVAVGGITEEEHRYVGMTVRGVKA